MKNFPPALIGTIFCFIVWLSIGFMIYCAARQFERARDTNGKRLYPNFDADSWLMTTVSFFWPIAIALSPAILLGILFVWIGSHIGDYIGKKITQFIAFRRSLTIP